VLVPKPYTPYSRAGVLDRSEFRRRLKLLEATLRRVDNLKFDRPSYREAVWQAILSRGDKDTYELIDQLADHGSLGRLLTDHRAGAVDRALRPVEGNPVWRFIASAPASTASAAPS
jgi:hypothetical protein